MNFQRRMNHQIEELNTLVKTYLAPSQIHGVGVFALRDIQKGERLFSDIKPLLFEVPYEMFDKIDIDVREQILSQWPQVVNGSKFIFPTIRVQAYINHDDEPNYSAELDMVLKDIKKGEEITEDYKNIPNAEKIFAFLEK